MILGKSVDKLCVMGYSGDMETTKDYTNTQLCFTVYHEAWYWQSARLPDIEFDIGVHRQYVEPDTDAGTIAWEFTIQWEVFQSGVRPQTNMRVKIFDDALATFAEVPELFTALADFHTPVGSPTPKPDAIIELLKSLGFVDITPRERP